MEGNGLSEGREESENLLDGSGQRIWRKRLGEKEIGREGKKKGGGSKERQGGERGSKKGECRGR